MTVFRVVAMWDGDPNHRDSRLTMDVPVDSDGRVRELPFFGAMGSLRDNAPFRDPFVVQTDGQVLQYHDRKNTDNSNRWVNIIGRTIKLGEVFTFFESDTGESLYRITAVTPL